MIVYWATKLRGFLKHISKYTDDVCFIQKDQYYEVSSKLRVFKSQLIRSRLLNPLGVFQVVKVSGKECDVYGSFNRFLESDKPYFLYLENPTALYHYALGRVKRGRGKRQFEKRLRDPHLKYIVCMSDACRSTFEEINMPLPDTVKMKTIYPLVPENSYATEEVIHQKSYQEELKCLYCVQGKRFYTKGGKDVLEAVTALQDAGCKIHLTVITNLSALDADTLQFIQNREGISLHDFTFPYDELEQIYAQTAVLLQPSSDESFGLTVLEAMKGGCAILSSKLYAFSEMVEHGKNGILIEPKYWSFTPNNLPNPAAWGYEKKIRLANKKSQKYIDDIKNALRLFYEDRDLLYKYSKHSLELSHTKFAVSTICDQWNDVWETLKGNADET